MPDTSPRLELPYLLPSQAQKHVTHNEALQRLDALVQLSVKALDAETPPAAPDAGDMHALGASPTGDWAANAGRLALWDGAIWQFFTPQDGWRAFDQGTRALYAFDGTGWRADILDLQNLDGLGIGTSSDTLNRLAVASQASLFTNAGAGHQIKINKAGAGDTASLLFQSDWTGHAEMGLAGDTAFSVKVSGDGSAWYDALRIDPATQEVALSPDGVVRARLSNTAMQLDVPLTGAAVQSNGEDMNSGRLVRVGAFGLGSTDASLGRKNSGNTPLGSGFYSGNGGSADPATFPDSACRYNPFLSLNRRVSDGVYRIKRIFFKGNTPIIWESPDSAVTWGMPNELYGTENLLGAVLQSAGVPTGAVIERAANANGEYMRLADGTQICQISRMPDITTAPVGALHKSTTDFGGWTFPAAFAAPPHVQASIQGTDEWCAAGAATTTAVAGVTVFAALSLAGASRTITTLAVGRWF